VQVAQGAAKLAVMANRTLVEQADFETAASELHRVAQ
jgi:hypothetical protein